MPPTLASNGGRRYDRWMIYRVEFYKDGKLIHFKSWDLGLDAAKQHATGMVKPYGATSSRILDSKRKEVFSYALPDRT